MIDQVNFSSRSSHVDRAQGADTHAELSSAIGLNSYSLEFVNY